MVLRMTMLKNLRSQHFVEDPGTCVLLHAQLLRRYVCISRSAEFASHCSLAHRIVSVSGLAARASHCCKDPVYGTHRPQLTRTVFV